MIGSWFRRRPKPADEQDCWLVYLEGAGGWDQEHLTVAAVTGTCEEAELLRNEAIQGRIERPNQIENYSFNPANAEPLRRGEHRTVFLLVTGPADEQEGEEVFESRDDGIAACENLRSCGLGDARLLEVVTNRWIWDIDSATGHGG